MRLKRLGAMSLLAFTVTACTAALAVEPDPTGSPPTTSLPPAVVDAPGTITTRIETEPSTVYCLDGTEHVPGTIRVDTYEDGTEHKSQDTEGTCRPWPTRCFDGAWFIPPTPLAGYQSQCLQYGRPLFRWWALLIFGAEAHIAYRVIECESHWNPRAHNRSGATGIMQLLGWEGLARKMGQNLWDPHGNMIVGREVRRLTGWDAWSCF